MPTTCARQDRAHSHRCLRPGRPNAAAAPGGNPAIQASTRPRPHPASTDTAHTPMHATRDRLTRARARRRSSGGGAAACARPVPCDRTAPRPRAWHIDDISGVTVGVCVCSVYYQPAAGGPLSRPPAGCALCGQSLRPSLAPTTSGDLQPIFSCVDSRGTHPRGMYVGMCWVKGESTIEREEQ